MTTKTDTRAAFEKWLGARADDPSLPHGLMRDAFCAGVEADRQGRMPSDEELLKVCESAGFLFHYDRYVPGSGYGLQAKAYTLENFRALLSRYSSGQPAKPSNLGELGSRPGKSDQCGQPAASAEPNTHIDDDAVDHFAAAMKEKLAQARAKGRHGWHECPPEDLSAMLRAHVEKGDPRDVANFCMFLWSPGQPISAVPVAQEPVARANIYMHKGRRQFLLTELGTKAAGDLGVGVHDLFAAPVAAQAQRVVNQQMTTAASDVLADTQRAIIEAAERRGYERAIAECGQVAREAKGE